MVKLAHITAFVISTLPLRHVALLFLVLVRDCRLRYMTASVTVFDFLFLLEFANTCEFLLI